MRLSVILYIGACCLSQLVATSAGAVTLYDDIVSLRPLQPSPPPPAAVCVFLRCLDIWAVCLLVSCSRQPCLHFVHRRGGRPAAAFDNRRHSHRRVLLCPLRILRVLPLCHSAASTYDRC